MAVERFQPPQINQQLKTGVYGGEGGAHAPDTEQKSLCKAEGGGGGQKAGKSSLFLKAEWGFVCLFVFMLLQNLNPLLYSWSL